jgi:hypothetical protein
MEDQPEATDFDDDHDVEPAPAGADEPATPTAASPTVVPSSAAAPAASGVAGVDAALARLRDVESAPLDEHVEIFDDVQRQLHDALAELDDEQ